MSRDTNFYYSFLVLPAEKRQAIVAVWDFCRAVDDAVDEPPAVPGDASPDVAAEISRWRDELARCYDGETAPETDQGRRLRPLVRRFDLPRQPFEDLIDGVAMDVSRPRYETFDELYEYCLKVASSVGLVCIEIFGYRSGSAREYAVVLGVALQLTNIIRDVSTDLKQDRIYLPQEDLRRFGCTEADLKSGLSPNVGRLLEFECRRAREYYVKAAAILPRGDAQRLVAAEIMGAIYLAILRRIETRGYDVFSEVVRVPRPRRAMIAATVWLRSLVGIHPAARP